MRHRDLLHRASGLHGVGAPLRRDQGQALRAPARPDHAPSALGGAQGTASDIEIQADEIKRLKTAIYEIYSKHTGKATSQIAKDLDRDFFMSAEQSKVRDRRQRDHRDHEVADEGERLIAVPR